MVLAAIFGAGSNIGEAVATCFLEKGYAVAALSRRGAPSLQRLKNLHPHKLKLYELDCANTTTTIKAFDQIEQDFNNKIGVVLYNAYCLVKTDTRTVLDVSVQDLRNSLEVNFITPFALAKRASDSFAEASGDIPKAFIYTGNGLSDSILFPRTVPGLLSLAVGKSAASLLVDAASQSFETEGYRFHYIDERKENGEPVYEGTDATSHAHLVWKLVNDTEQSAWRIVFSKSPDLSHDYKVSCVTNRM